MDHNGFSIQKCRWFDAPHHVTEVNHVWHILKSFQKSYLIPHICTSLDVKLKLIRKQQKSYERHPLLQHGLCRTDLYTLFYKNQAAWYFVRPAQVVTWRTVAIIIRVVLLSPYLCIRGVSLSSTHYNQSRRMYTNQRHQYIRLIWR
jgi:hypothetical protein